MMFRVKDKTVLVTGANRGIGKAVLEEAIHRGAAKVYAAVRNTDSASPLVAKFGECIVPIRLDLEDPASITAAAEVATDVDVVVNNAGVFKRATPLQDHAIDALQVEMNVNVYGLIRVAQAFAPILKANGGGALVQLNSVASVKSVSDFVTYCASKAASYSITQGLRDSLRKQGTQVISVHPGPIATDMATEIGFGGTAESPSLVAIAIFNAIAEGHFHVWPGAKATRIGAAYQSFAENIIEADMQGSPA